MKTYIFLSHLSGDEVVFTRWVEIPIFLSHLSGDEDQSVGIVNV